MKKLIVLAGSPNSGKTLSANGVIVRILNAGGTVVKALSGVTEFWNTASGGAAVTEFRGERIAVITYGDKVADLEPLFQSSDVVDCDTVVCCSHATRGRQVFIFFHELIKSLDLEKTQVIPIHKNLLSRLGETEKDKERANNHTADLIFGML